MKTSINILSKYRSELMGLCMITILLVHISIFAPSSLDRVLLLPSTWFYVPGFFILSGMSTWYSWSREPVFLKFMQKRLLRIYITYIGISLPFILLFYFVKNDDIWFIIENITLASIVTRGNEYGMWFLFTIMVFYLVFGCISYVAEKTVKQHPLEWGSIVLLLIAVIWYIIVNTGSFCNTTLMLANNFPYFAIGLCSGYCCKENKKVATYIVVGLFAVGLALSKYLDSSNMCYIIINLASQTTALIIAGLLTKRLPEYIKRPLRYIGDNSLEIYILHLFLYSALTLILDSRIICTTIAIGSALIVCKPIHRVLNHTISKQ